MRGMEASSPVSPSAALPGARSALLLLLAINLFNYIDRQVLAAVEPEIRKELLHGVGNDRAKTLMGLLSTAFLFSYMLTAPVFGWLADRHRRWTLIGIGVVLWSLASGASGLEWPFADLTLAYWALFVTRCFVGIGEGAYGPIAPAMIADLYPVQRRGRVMAWFYLAIPVGGALGYAFGEVVLRQTESWRWPFFLVVPPGIALGIWCFFMKDPSRGRSDAVAVDTRKATVVDTLRVLLIPSYLFNTLGMTAMTFAIGGLAFWMPAYLDETAAPGLGPLGPRLLFGVITALAGLLATILGGLAGDWFKPKLPGSYFVVSGTAMLLGFPMMLGFLCAPWPMAWVFVFMAVFCLFFNTGPTNTILANVTHPSVRASAFALNILIIHLLGDAISPPVIGFVADQEGISLVGFTGLRAGFLLVSILMLVGGALWLWGSRHLERDTRRFSSQ